jgi:7-cyano-7-deazaguanine synthase
MDSCITTAIAKAQDYALALLHADYGQRTQAREKQAVRDIADFYEVRAPHRLIIRFGTLKAISAHAHIQ